MAIERLGKLAGLVALPALAGGLYLGLVWAPPDAMMGDVQRIMYVHFPSWIATGLAYLTAFVCSLLYLVRRTPRLDYLAHAGVEVGVLFNATGLITGSIWGRPTWGVWWTWDPRLTTTAIMLVMFAGYLIVRAFIEDPDARAGRGAGGDRRLRERADRVHVGPLVAHAAPGAVQPVHRPSRHGGGPAGHDGDVRAAGVLSDDAALRAGPPRGRRGTGRGRAAWIT